LVGELTPSLSQIGATLACDQAHDRIVEDGEHVWSVAHTQLRMIFAQGHIPSKVQAILDCPLPTHQRQEPFG
jgi:hypothetical protein